MKILSKLPKLAKTILVSLLVVTTGAFLAPTVLHRSVGQGVAVPATFSNYELAGNPFNRRTSPLFSVGTTCPNTVSRTDPSSCQNTEGEPQIRADPSGNFYGSSENVFCVIGGQCGGTFAWRSTDGGSSFKTLPLPNSFSSGQIPPNCVDHCQGVGLSPAGGDTDIAVAPRRNANEFFNVYVASLETVPPLANIFVSTSTNGGDSWVVPPKPAASIPVDDREWIAADGANKVCISYHAILTTNVIFVDCSYNAGATFTQHASAFDTNHLFHAGFNNEIGNLAIDPRNHVIYQVFSSIGDASELLPTSCNISCGTHAVWVAVSIDGGNSFTDYLVYNNPNVFLNYGHQFVNVSVDRAGNVYVVYSDDHNLFYSFSTTFGQTWSAPSSPINKPPSNTAIMPWSSAGAAGSLDVVWYGTSTTGGPPDNFPSSATWYVYFSQNLAATTANSAWTQVPASGVIHRGGVCEGGVACAGNSNQNRDLLDDFGVAASPTTGLAAIIYTDDQFLDSQAEPATRRDDGSMICTANLSNTVDCSHTDIAVQTGGSGVNQQGQEFEVGEEDFEETNLSGSGSPAPDFKMQVLNTGTVAITSLSVQISGLPLAFAWNPAFPLQPGQTASARTTSVPLGLVLAVGNIYTVTITATLANGTTATQTTKAIYTLGAGLGL